MSVSRDRPSPPYSKNYSQEQDDKLLEPFSYLLQVPGKNVRKQLLRAFNAWLKVPDDKAEKIGDIVQMLHNASLLLDDIEDNSSMRRGIPVAHKVYGIPSVINTANYVMFIALERTIALGHPEAVRVYSEQMLELHRGQGKEIYWRDNYHCPTEEEYKTMTIGKTGGLFNLAVRLLQLFSSSSEDFTELASLLGLYFQIRDDYANLCLDEYAKNKSFAEDFTEGKFSFPIIYAIRQHPADNQLMNILRQRTSDIEVKTYAVSLLRKAGAFDYTKEVLEELDSKARTEIKRLGGNDQLIAILDDLKNWAE